MTDHVQPEAHGAPAAGGTLLLVMSWLWVGIPLAWGVLETLRTCMALFH